MKKKMITFLAAAALLLPGKEAGAQQNPVWSLPPSQIKFPALSYTALPSGPYLPDYYMGESGRVHNAMIDNSGNLKFFVVGENVYDAGANWIGELNYNGSTKYGAYEIAIVPDPGNCNRYYIVTFQSETGHCRFPYYATLDLSQPNDFDPSRMGLLLPVGVGNLNSLDVPGYFPNAGHAGGGQVAVSKLRSDNSRLMFISNGEALFRYKITGSGIAYDSYTIPFINPSPAQDEVWGEMELVETGGGNYRIAAPYKYEAWVGTALDFRIGAFTADLNASGNLIAGTRRVFSLYPSGSSWPNIHGLEFSPSGNILYIVHEATSLSPGTLEYVNFGVVTPTMSTLSLTGINNFRYSQIELATDNKIYFAHGTRLASLSGTEVPGTAVWNNSAVTISYNPLIDGMGLKQFLLPDQIDSMDYHAHFEATTQCCLDNQVYDKTSFTAATNATWTGTSNPINGGTGSTVTIKESLIIPAGKIITITNMTFKFAPGARVIIERGTSTLAGGRLTLNGTVFTSDERCGPMWQGVQVHGNITNNQTPTSTTKQGMLVMTNAASIKNARIGVTMSKRNQALTYPFNWGTMDLTYAGGIVRATNSSFINNGMDVEFRKYNAPNAVNNQSNFVNTEFITNGLLNDPTLYSGQHVYMHDVVGVQFNGCTFRNMTPALYAINQKGVGIVGYNAHFYVRARCIGLSLPCSSFDRSLFQDLSTGIFDMTSNALRTVEVDRGDFINNYAGIYLSGTQAATVTRNYFEVNRDPIQANYGLLLASSTGYQVEENEFTEFSDPVFPAAGNTYGVIVANSGVLHNEIYRNEFHDIRIGGQAQGTNGEHYAYGDPNASNQGLQFRCNTFYNDLFQADIAVTSGKIDYQQGYCLPVSNPSAISTPAGNRFSHSLFDPQNDINANNTVLAFNYAHHNDVITTPLYYNTTIVVPQPCGLNISDASCPTRLSDGGISHAGLMARSGELRTLIAEKKALIDGGNTQALLEMIAANGDGLEENLLGASPYLSKEVLMAFMESKWKEESLVKVMVANSALLPGLMEQIGNLGLSADIMAQIEEAQAMESPMGLLLGEISALESERNTIVDELMGFYLTDTLTDNPLDSLVKILLPESGRTRKQQLCEVYLIGGKTDLAQAVLDELVAQDGMNSYSIVTQINIDLANEVSPGEAILNNADMVALLEQVVADENDAMSRTRAQALLGMAYNMMYTCGIEKLKNPYGSKSMVLPNEDRESSKGELKLYPNPANEWVTVLFDQATDQVRTLEVVSVTGQTVLNTMVKAGDLSVQLDLNSLLPGVYLVKVKEGKENRSPVRLVVSK